MTLLDTFVRQVDLKNLTKGMAVRDAIEAERTDQQMHVQRIKPGTEQPLLGAATQNLAQ
ncbi:hypothetical protein D3C74_457110 [compost metagenome]